MKWLDGHRARSVVVGFVVGAVLCGLQRASAAAANQVPVTNAGLPRYAAEDPVVLDGSGSYDPDDSGPLTFMWTQMSGVPLGIADADTARPTISGFVQTSEIQECEFELLVSDGELASRPDAVKVIIVPDFGENMVRLTNDSFDPDKPTVVVFQGGNCIVGGSFQVAGVQVWDPELLSMINVVNFHEGYMPDTTGNLRTYYGCGDMVVVYLSRVAPDYRQPIQVLGVSTGGQPAVDAGIRLNRTYGDARYAVNRITLCDAGTNCRSYEDYAKGIAAYLANPVDGEQCWVDNYVSATARFYPNALNIGFHTVSHPLAINWYNNTWSRVEWRNDFNHGVVAGIYWYLIGPGRNLQLAWTPDAQTYKFKRYGNELTGHMDFYDALNHPGRLPEPVTLVGPVDGAVVDTNGGVLSCQESENAVGYQLLFGPDPYHLVYLYSDTPSPPNEPVSVFPFEQTWWTVRAYDRYGSTIHADPMCIHTESVNAQPIENTATGQTYASIQQAINDAHPGDEIIISSGVCQHGENINFKGKNLTLRSTDPNDPAVVAATIINGGHRASAVTFSGAEEAACVLDGLTITGGMVGISCRDASPTVRNCTIGGARSSIEYWDGSEPMIVGCTLLGQMRENDPRLIAHWRLDETEGIVAHDSVGTNDGTVMGLPHWRSSAGTIDGALELGGATFVATDCVLSPSDGPFSVLAWIKGGAPGQGIIAQRQDGANWLMAGAATGALMTELKGDGRFSSTLSSETIITDGNWHRIGFTWDGTNRSLYVDDVLVADDTQVGLTGSLGGFLIGCGKAMAPGTFFTGLIDDVRIYNRAVKP